jgi:hypothetical protein
MTLNLKAASDAVNKMAEYLHPITQQPLTPEQETARALGLELRDLINETYEGEQREQAIALWHERLGDPSVPDTAMGMIDVNMQIVAKILVGTFLPDQDPEQELVTRQRAFARAMQERLAQKQELSDAP